MRSHRRTGWQWLWIGLGMVLTAATLGVTLAEDDITISVFGVVVTGLCGFATYVVYDDTRHG